MLTSSINRYLIPAVLALWLVGCGAPPPKPVITKPAESKQEEQMLDTAGKEYESALGAMQGAKYAEAEKLLVPMTQKYPNLAGPYANLGIVYMQTKRPKQAEEAFNKAISLNPKVASVYNQLGLFYREEGRFQDARKAYEGAIAADPSYTKAILNLGILHDLYLMDGESALKYYAKYVELVKPGPNDPVTKWIADLASRAKKAAPPPKSDDTAAPAAPAAQ